MFILLKVRIIYLDFDLFLVEKGFNVYTLFYTFANNISFSAFFHRKNLNWPFTGTTTLIKLSLWLLHRMQGVKKFSLNFINN